MINALEAFSIANKFLRLSQSQDNWHQLHLLISIANMKGEAARGIQNDVAVINKRSSKL